MISFDISCNKKETRPSGIVLRFLNGHLMLFENNLSYRATELEVRTIITTARDIQALLSYSLAVVWLLEMIVHIEIDSV